MSAEGPERQPRPTIHKGREFAMRSNNSKSTMSATKIAGLIALAASTLIGVGAALVVSGNAAAARASVGYHRQHLVLDADLRAARGEGYTDADLAPITRTLKAVDGTIEPWWIPGRSEFYNHDTQTVDQLRKDLKRLEQRISNQTQASTNRRVVAAKAAIEQDRSLLAADSDLEALQRRVDDIGKAQSQARTIAELRTANKEAQSVATEAAALATQLRQENADLQTAGQDLLAQHGGNLDAIHKIGNDAAGAGRNEATIAFYMNKPSPFKNMEAVSRAYGRLEKFAAQVGSGDASEAATAAAAVQRFSGQVHDGLMTGLPSKAILISYSGQELWAYQDSKVVQNTLVTTGRPELATDIGPMKVLAKDSPWKMHSPWPPGSQWWYPDTVVQMVLWFTNTGEGLHDAYWQGCCWGPGSQFGPSASHGCIHVPMGAEKFLFDWADIGTPVILYPGDGTPVAHQLEQISTDDQGNPLHGPA